MVANWIDRRWLRIVQPDGYRAPEVTLEAGWSTPVDIWSFGCIVRNLEEPKSDIVGIRNVRWKIPF